jgi:Tfp pilus assembly protein PilF
VEAEQLKPHAEKDDSGDLRLVKQAWEEPSDQVRQGLSDSRSQTFPGLFYLLFEYRFSGVLVLKADGVQTNIYLSRGIPVFVELGQFEHSLGQLLLKSGRIDKSQYIRTIKHMTESMVGHEEKRMGECLVELGILTSADVYESLQEQLHEKLISCFRWESTRCELRQGSDWLKDVCIIEAKPVGQLILDGIRRYYNHQRLEQLLEPYSGRYPRLTEQGKTEEMRLEISGQERRFIQMIDGTRTLASLIASQSSPLSAMQLLVLLWFTRRLTFSDRPRTRRRDGDKVRDAVVKEVPLSLEDPDNPPGGLKDVSYFYTKRRRDAEEEHLQDEVPALYELADLVSARIELSTMPTRRDTPETQRHCFVASAWAREWYFDKLGRLSRSQEPAILEQQAWNRRVTMARQACWVGQQFLRNGRLQQAAARFQRAIDLDPEDQSYKLLSAWVEYQLAGEKQERRMLFGSVARDLALKELTENSSNAKAHCVLGHFLRLEGQQEQALHHLQQAIDLDAVDHEARRELAQLRQKRLRDRALAS